VRNIILISILLLFSLSFVNAQDSTKQKLIQRVRVLDSAIVIQQNSMYDRPFIGNSKAKIALGGYVEGNTNYFAEDGVTEGFGMELRRFNIFLYSNISRKIKFLSELEFEHGTEEIAIETAQLDFEINQGLNFRAGILMPQIGLFNVNHDSPKWDVIDRPLVSSMIIPSTLSEVGFGVFGKFYFGKNVFSYDAYLVNGLQDGIVYNEEGRTFIPGGKNPSTFEEDNNGTPSFNGRLAIKNSLLGEFGLSYYGGVYNSFKKEGDVVEDKRYLGIYAFDFTTSFYKFNLKGEAVHATIDLPVGFTDITGSEQTGVFVDLTYPIYKGKIAVFENSQITLFTRFNFVDFNSGNFSFNKELKKGDEIIGFTSGVSFRPNPSTIIKANYVYQQSTDVLNNPPGLLGGIQFGVASYF
jgi:hypothetical protein